MQSKRYSPVWEETFQVRSFDIGLNRTMRISSICSYFQEVAGKHATHLDVGYKFVRQSGMVWMLSRFYMNIHQLPAWNDTFRIETWPLGNERFFYRRDYRLSIGPETLVNATSYWILLNLATRRPTIIPLDEQVMHHNAGRFSMEKPAAGFPLVGSAETQELRVKYSDLDQNRHVNNARYVEWIFDILDPELLENRIPSFFAIEYKQEVKAGDTVLLRSAEADAEPLTFAAEGCLSGTGQVCVRAKIVFK
jgi:medium-chain acyl-[acyl-carrier-protein] hydrolase